jgi:hypothetical protein
MGSKSLCSCSDHYTTCRSVASCHVSLHVLVFGIAAGLSCSIAVVPKDPPSLRLRDNLSFAEAAATDDDEDAEEEEALAVLFVIGKGGSPCSLLSLLVNRCALKSASSLLRSAAFLGGRWVVQEGERFDFSQSEKEPLRMYSVASLLFSHCNSRRGNFHLAKIDRERVKHCHDTTEGHHSVP